MKITYGLLSALTFSISSAFAGTMGPVETVPDFGGLYLGLGSGFTSIFVKNTTTSQFQPGSGNVSRYTDTAVLFTGDVGYGLMFQQNFYLGAKGSVYYTPLQQTSESSFTTKFDNGGSSAVLYGNDTLRRSYQPTYNIDLVLGYEIAPSFLPFVEAGVSFSNLRQRAVLERDVIIARVDNIGYNQLKVTGYQTGYNVGIGGNYLVNQHFFLSSELVYNNFGNNSGSVSYLLPGTSVTETHTGKEAANSVSLFVGASYLFPI